MRKAYRLKHAAQGKARLLLFAFVIGMSFFILICGSASPVSAHALQTQYSQALLHALLVKSDPTADQVLQAPPSRVRMWFSEDLNPYTSRAVVVDTTNREVDNRDSQVSGSTPREMDISLPLLPAGTYIVDWRTQSSEDGHIVGGSFIFRIARPDGTVPPVPAVLPTGHIPGAGGSGASTSSALDGPTILQTLATWIALLLMTFWVGGLIWETWILPPSLVRDSIVASGATLATRRFRRIAPYMLGLLLIANVGIVLAQSAELAGEWSGLFSAPLLHAVLFGSRFGEFWWMRELVSVAALALTSIAARRNWKRCRVDDLPQLPSVEQQNPNSLPDWRREALIVFRSVPRLPARLARGWVARSWLGRAECILGALLIVAFAMSGHAAAVPANEFVYAISVDLLHLLCNAAWIGGLLYITIILVPVSRSLSAQQRARLHALGVPEFSAIAIVSAVVLATTGSLNTAIHLTSIEQFLTTSYGRILAVKIEIFLVMVAISAYHAFFLRPRLARSLIHDVSSVDSVASIPMYEREQEISAANTTKVATKEDRARSAASTASVSSRTARNDADAENSVAKSSKSSLTSETFKDVPISSHTQTLVERLEDWLGREAMIGAAVLLCVALLAAFAGSLTLPPQNAGASASHLGNFTQSQTVQSYAITLLVTPDTFGTNTFTVTVLDAHQKPVVGASVLVQSQMLDMDMGVQNVQLKEVGQSAPGVYSGQSDLTMAGHWAAVVKVLPPNAKDFVQATYRFSAR